MVFLEHPQIIKYLKGVNDLRAPTQKITSVWDVKILFHYFNHKGENDQLSDKSFTQNVIFAVGRPKNGHCMFFHSR